MKFDTILIVIFCVLFVAILIKGGVEATTPPPRCEEGYVYVQPNCVPGYRP